MSQSLLRKQFLNLAYLDNTFQQLKPIISIAFSWHRGAPISQCLHTNALICDTLVILITAKLLTLFVHIVVSASAIFFFSLSALSPLQDVMPIHILMLLPQTLCPIMQVLGLQNVHNMGPRCVWVSSILFEKR